MTAVEPRHVPQPSDAQWEAVRNTDRHMLVSAGAGTGKTFTVVSHVLYLMGVEMRGSVHPSPLQLDEIAAITYTNKAAAELKEHLRARLRATGRREDAYRVDTARVGTIHAFCGDILREFALRGSLAPGLTLLDDSESRILRAGCVRDALLEALECAPDSPQRVEGLDSLLAEHSVGDVEQWVGELLELGDHLRSIIDHAAERAPLERSLLALAQRAEDRFVEYLRAHGQMDFDRMIVWTRDLIRSDVAVRRTLQRRIRVLIIDEFQDVDPVQREIAYLLGDPASRAGDTTRLMLVGDPKQSIYSFRKADVRVWRSVEEDFRRNDLGIVVPIADSRRSVPPVLAFVDHAIGRLLDEPIGASSVLRDFEVAYHPVRPLREDGPGDRAVEFLCVPANDGRCQKVAVVRESEAQAVAERALELHASGEMRWADMALLLSGWGALDIYQNALERAGIPFYALRSEGFYEQREIIDLIVALEAIRNANDDRALLGFLRSPFVGVTDETLLRLATKLPSPLWPELSQGEVRLIADETERDLLTRGVSLLERLIPMRDRVMTSVLVDELLADTAYLAHLSLLGEPGLQAIANVRKFVRKASSATDGGLGRFLEEIEVARGMKMREGNAPLYGENDDVVTITSIHSSKGLEWKVVFWCDLVREHRNQGSSLLTSGSRVSLGGAARDGDDDADDAPDTELPDAGRDELTAELRDERDAESKRLWYVAATRAKDRLVVCVPQGRSKSAIDEDRRRAKAGEPPSRAFKSASDAMKLSFPSLGSTATERYRSGDGAEYEAVVHSPLVIDTETNGAPPRVHAPLDASQLAAPPVPIEVLSGRARHSATELLALERCGKRRWFKYVAGVREPQRPARECSGEINAIKRGLIVHDVLEQLRENDDLDALLDDAVQRHDPDAPLPDAVEGARYRDAIRDELRAVMSQPGYREILDAPGARRELPFLHIVDADTYIEGKIDLVAPGPDGYRVIDVKTSQCDPDVAVTKAEQYAIQKAVYVRALEAIGGAPVADFGFQFSAIATNVGGSITERERAALDERLAATLEELRVRPPTLAKSADECRYCGYLSAGWCPGVAELAIRSEDVS
ncbi:MAG: UvrD-helicase domain-containing protein [Gemmatimonadaceae bacterium]|nr:UvrD-helicase domain-containing protein [Gemmatimonadaceae bacterium]